MEYDSSEDSTYSLLSPIYHDSFEGSDDELEVEQLQQRMRSLPVSAEDVRHPTPHRYCLPFTHFEWSLKVIHVLMPLCSDVFSVFYKRSGKLQVQRKVAEVKLDKSVSLQNLSAWEHWLVTKAKEERLKLEQKALEVQIHMIF